MKWTGIGGLACLLVAAPAWAQPEQPEEPPTGAFEPVEGADEDAADEDAADEDAAEATPPTPPAEATPGEPPAPPPGTAAAAPAGAGQPAPGYGPPAGQAGYPPPGAPPPGYGPPPGYEPQPPPPPQPDPVRDVSLTLSPLHLILPVFEVMGEIRVADHVGAAVIGGYGSVSGTETRLDLNTGRTTERTIDFRVLELGAQIAGYPLDAFDGLQVGVELLWVRVQTDDLADGTASGEGSGLAVGPFVGYKLITSGGFTFLAQGGFEYAAVKAEVDDNGRGAGVGASTDDDLILLVNLNIGWSF